MKISLTSVAPNIDSEIDPRFGRGAYLLVVETESLQWEAHANPGMNASGGAGILAAQFVTDQKIYAALSGDFGPHALAALQAAGVSMYLYGNCRTAREAVEHFRAGTLERVGTVTCGDDDSGYHGPA